MAKNCVPVLFESAEDCCGCGACVAKCPKSAISMQEDACGYVYPEIDSGRCIGCGACERACGFHGRLGRRTAGASYAASGKGDVSRSASGGAFASLATSIIEAGGIVYGAAYDTEADGLYVRHRAADNVGDLCGLLNSKYVQSDAGVCFPDIKEQLRSGRQVLFSGTPCQVAGLKGYLGQEWPNLYTADLVCHGVPSGSMFRGSVAAHEARLGSRAVDYLFRCKRDGWGHSLLLLLLLEDGREVTVQAGKDPYYDMFLHLKTLRESCYSCPFASDYRAGDVTLGDFWGVEYNCPEVLNDSVAFDVHKGISCLLANNRRGRELVERYGAGLNLRKVPFEAIAKDNDQLRHPSERPDDRQLYLEAYERGGWPAMERLWRRRERGVKWLSKRVANKLLPSKVKAVVKRMLGRYL